MLTDTVGFVSDLPHALVEAFKSTLQEAMDADLLIHVVDVSDPEYKQKIEIVNGVLNELGATNIPTIVCYNKIDKNPYANFNEDTFHLTISAKENINIDKLKNSICEILFPGVKDEY